MDLLRPHGYPDRSAGRGGNTVADSNHSAVLTRADARRRVFEDLPLEHVHRADEVRDEFRHWSLIDVRRRTHLYDLAVIHHTHARRQRHRLFLVMGHDDERHAELLLDVEQLELGVLAELFVQSCQGLIQQQEFRAFRERSRERHTLSLAAG